MPFPYTEPTKSNSCASKTQTADVTTARHLLQQDVCSTIKTFIFTRKLTQTYILLMLDVWSDCTIDLQSGAVSKFLVEVFPQNDIWHFSAFIECWGIHSKFKDKIKWQITPRRTSPVTKSSHISIHLKHLANQSKKATKPSHQITQSN